MMYNETQRQQLKQIAQASVKNGLTAGKALAININEVELTLRAARATFVTLKIKGKLRGCIGRLHAERPLVEDLAENAYAAAFRDPRFPPLNETEYLLLQYHISVLEEPEDLVVSSEAELIEKLVPGQDGVILSDGRHQGTFLPSVWESLPNPADFIKHLKRKAGLPASSWSDHYRVQRYSVEEF